jgi:outer membrane protein assembly factor BamE (lipoprotein component of BamABCDE complex)
VVICLVGGIAAWSYYAEQQPRESSYSSTSSSYTASYESNTHGYESSGVQTSPPPAAPPSTAPALDRALPQPGPGPFTLGSTRAEVEAAEGTPSGIDKLSGETWEYDSARVEFRDGKVYAWHGSPLRKLNVELLPHDLAKAAVARSRGYFTLGSSKDEVLAVQGTPDALDRLSGETWSYETSTVQFADDKVTEWHGSPIGSALKVHLEPRSKPAADAAAQRGFYGPSATKDEVLAVEGTPTSIDKLSGETWSYGTSTIRFSNGRIAEYHNSPIGPALKIRADATTDTNGEAPKTATVAGFMRAFMAAMDNVADDVCSCTTIVCAQEIVASAKDRGFNAGYGYTKDKNMTPELQDFISTMLTGSGDSLTNYVTTNYPAWWSRFKPRIEGCVADLKARGL